MRDHFFKSALPRLLVAFLLATVLAACSDSSGSSSPPPPAGTPPPPPPAASGLIALGTSTNFILTDNATRATLTATLVDSSGAVMAGVVVSFATTSGFLSASRATTDADGQAIVYLRSGTLDFTNRTATVSATVGAQSRSIPILIRGSTLALTLPSNSIQVGAPPMAVSATAADASGQGKPGQTIRFSISAPIIGGGAGTLSATMLTTDTVGVAAPLTFTPTAAGTVVLTAEWLNSAGAAGVVTATTTRNIIVTATGGIAFAITNPAANPKALTTLATQLLEVTVPTQIAGVTVVSVRISSTAGTWTGITQVTAPRPSIIQTPALNAVSATYTAPNSSGSVSVQVDALDLNGTILSSCRVHL